MPASRHLPIFFATVNLDEVIHAQALGFTSQFYEFVCANSAQEAEALVETWAKARGYKVKRVSVGDCASVQQDVNTYTFPEQIINMPQAILDAVFARRGYPNCMWKSGRFVHLDSAVPV
jgi:hypothetical protein